MGVWVCVFVCAYLHVCVCVGELCYWICGLYLLNGQDQVEKGIMFTEADRVELHNAVTAEMEDLADKASTGYARRHEGFFFCIMFNYFQTESSLLPWFR